MTLIFSVVALVYDHRGWVLAASRRGRPRDLGFPGGKVDVRETPDEAVRRELLEETSIVAHDIVQIFEALDRFEHGEPRPCSTYFVRSWSGVAHSREPGIEARWVPWPRMLSKANTFRDYNQRLYDHLGVGARR